MSKILGMLDKNIQASTELMQFVGLVGEGWDKTERGRVLADRAIESAGQCEGWIGRD